MLNNNDLKIHFINVDHGDATIIEFPDYGNPKIPHFAVVDLGPDDYPCFTYISDYMENLIKLRRNGDPELKYEIDFVCVTHPHSDHFGGLEEFMTRFEDNVLNFWDCGFRTTNDEYNRAIDGIGKNNNITFTRLSSGTEFEFGDVRIIVMAPSIDLRNRFDTYGVNRNDASIILRIYYKYSRILLTGDAQFNSWGKVAEEFPRMTTISFFKDAIGLAKRREVTEQLESNLIKLSHHGSKHGSSLEYLERVKPEYVVVSAASNDWYLNNKPANWLNGFPHQLVKDMVKLLKVDVDKMYVTGDEGNVIFKYKGGKNPENQEAFNKRPNEPNFFNELKNTWTNL